MYNSSCQQGLVLPARLPKKDWRTLQLLEFLKWGINQNLKSLNSERTQELLHFIHNNHYKVLVLAKQPSLGKLHKAELSDPHLTATIRNSSVKAWKGEVGSIHPLPACLTWPVKLCEITITTATLGRMNIKAISFICKWLDLPQRLSNTALSATNALQLPLKPINWGYTKERTSLVLELRDTSDPSVTNVKESIWTKKI